jgi:hypothetical protein
VKVAFIELYNEQLFDLLSDKPRREDAIVDIREDVKESYFPQLYFIWVVCLSFCFVL